MEISVKVTVDALADEVWETLKDFGSIAEWDPGVAFVSIDDAAEPVERSIIRNDSVRMIERLTGIDEHHKVMTFKTMESNRPFRNKVDSMKVYDYGDTLCGVEWRSSFQPEGMSDVDAGKMLESEYSVALKSLNKEVSAIGSIAW